MVAIYMDLKITILLNNNFEEICKLLGILLKMGVMDLPRYQMFCSKEFRVGGIADSVLKNFPNICILWTTIISLPIEMIQNTTDWQRYNLFWIFYEINVSECSRNKIKTWMNKLISSKEKNRREAY